MPIKTDASTAPVVVALIAALCSIGTVVYAAITGARNSRRLAALQAELDRHKEITLEYLKAYVTLEIEGRNRTLEAFKEIIRSVQLLRDKIKRVLEFPHSYSPTILATEMKEISDSISEAYASNQVFLGADSDRALAHALKNECLSAADILHRYVRFPEQPLLNKLGELQRSIMARQMDLRNRARQFAELLITEAKTHVGREGGRLDGK